MTVDHMAGIRETFFQECAEQLEALESGLLALEEGGGDTELVNSIFRAVHSIKGGAGAFELTDVVRLAHVFETTLDLVRNEHLEPVPELVKLMLRAADILTDLVVSARDGVEADLANAVAVADELAQANTRVAGGDDDEGDDFAIDFQPLTIAIGDDGDEPGFAPVSSGNRFRILFRPKQELYSSANDPLLIIREIQRNGRAHVQCDCSAIPQLSSLDPAQGYLTWIIELETESSLNAISEVFEFVDGLCDLEIEPVRDAVPEVISPVFADEVPVAEPELNSTVVELKPRNAAPPVEKASAAADASKAVATAAPATIRVELDRVDRLINLVGELVINRSMLLQSVKEEGVRSSSTLAVGLDELEQLTREIQDSVMAIRAQPVKPLFQRMSRIVREIADATGKSVRLKTEGEATEVDKIVIERLADPLTHMIRNAVDHGLEAPAAREAAGKPSEGVIRLTAAHRSGRIIIEVADDGAGINRARVRETAVRKGIISADAQLSETEVENLLFAPGFSTAESISNISGRGVGMDVVKRSIQALGGRISISSTPGEGTVFTMSLPLTLAVLDGMIVSVNGQTLIVPLTAIVETLKPRRSDLHELPGADDRLIFSRGKIVPLLDIGRALGLGPGIKDPTEGVAILVEAERGVRSALLVDAIHDQRQVVIKSLEENYGRVNGIAAATILGNGRVALILDVDAVVSKCKSETTPQDSPQALIGLAS